MATAPVYDVDFYSDAVIADPYPHYRAMRDLGPVVHLPRNDGYAITRFADVRDALRNDKLFLSGRGVMMNEPTNQAAAGASLLNMDDRQHRDRRQVMARPLMPQALAPLREQIDAIAEELIDELVARGRFDGVADFAHVLPLKLVSRIVGLPEEGRERMLEWAGGIFNVMGNINHRFEEGLAGRDAALGYIMAVDPAALRPGSWGARAFEMVEQGIISDVEARLMIFDYVAPALDTTINATSSAIWLLGLNPDQWDLLRADPALIPAAIEEAIRLETPIRAFSRSLAEDADVDGVTLPKGARALIVYASANRDERRWDDAERYDIRRRAPQEQLAFGTGVHMCVGMHLARLEMRSLFGALVKRVRRFEVGETTRELHQLLRGLKSVEVRITDAD